MKRITLTVLFLFCSLYFFGQTQVLTKENKYEISIFCSKSDIQEKQNFLNIVEAFISKFYPKVDFPVYLSGWFDSYSTYSISFDGMYGHTLDWEKEIVEQKVKENHLNKPSINIIINPSDIENSLKIIEYGITKKKQLEKSYQKLRNRVDKDKTLTDKDKESIIIEEKLQSVLLRPLNKKIKTFLNTI